MPFITHLSPDTGTNHSCTYLTNVFKVLDIMSFSAHDLIDDIGTHLVPVL